MQRLSADWLSAPATQRLFDLLSDAPTYAVGGCVRNTLLQEPVKDIDIATQHHPEEVMSRAERVGLKAVPTGIAHGTVTVIVDEIAFEVTTFRRDVATDGRRAVVAFAETVEDDARRRDFTINALYCDAGGALFDPVDGLSDIADRRIRFIEDADRRIREDYLRSLRFFRFCAWYADSQAGMDPDALDAIARNLDGLETLSRERVGSELLRLLEAPRPAPAVATMRSTGVLGRVLPGADDTGLAPLIVMEEAMGVPPSAIRRLAVLGGDVVSLRLSKVQEGLVETLKLAVSLEPVELGFRHGFEVGRDALLVQAASLAQPVAPGALEKLKLGSQAVFPVNAADLMPEFQGKALGDKLRTLEARWIDSEFTLSRDDLLSRS